MDDIFTGDELETLLIPIKIDPRKRIIEGELQFAGEPITLSPAKHCHNSNHLKILLRLGYKVVMAFPVQLGKDTYAYVTLYRNKS